MKGAVRPLLQWQTRVGQPVHNVVTP
jgi:hypothetical protein